MIRCKYHSQFRTSQKQNYPTLIACRHLTNAPSTGAYFQYRISSHENSLCIFIWSMISWIYYALFYVAMWFDDIWHDDLTRCWPILLKFWLSMIISRKNMQPNIMLSSSGNIWCIPLPPLVMITSTILITILPHITIANRCSSHMMMRTTIFIKVANFALSWNYIHRQSHQGNIP